VSTACDCGNPSLRRHRRNLPYSRSHLQISRPGSSNCRFSQSYRPERLMRCHCGGQASLLRLASASFYVGLAPAFLGALRHDLPAKKFSDRLRLYSGTFHPGFHVFRPSRSLPWMGIFVHDRRRDLKRSPACQSGPMSVAAAHVLSGVAGSPIRQSQVSHLFQFRLKRASESSVSGPIRSLTE
jgi:hypothetical protein